MSLRALAKRLGVSHSIVSDAVKSGRLVDSVGRDPGGRPFIRDARAATREWKARATKPRAPAEDASLVDEQRRLVVARTRRVELETRLREGATVSRREAERDAFESARVVRDNILNVPDRISAELAVETDAGRVHARLTAALTEALAAVAEILDGERHA